MGGGVVAKEDGEKDFRGLMGERAVEKMKEREWGRNDGAENDGKSEGERTLKN